MSPKPLLVRFDKIDEFLRIYDGPRYLTVFDSENYDTVYNRKSKKQNHI